MRAVSSDLQAASQLLAILATALSRSAPMALPPFSKSAVNRRYIIRLICSRRSNIGTDLEAISAIDLISEHRRVGDVAKRDMNVAPVAAERVRQEERRRPRNEHQRFDRLMDQVRHLRAHCLMARPLRERELAAGKSNLVERAKRGK